MDGEDVGGRFEVKDGLHDPLASAAAKVAGAAPSITVDEGGGRTVGKIDARGFWVTGEQAPGFSFERTRAEP